MIMRGRTGENPPKPVNPLSEIEAKMEKALIQILSHEFGPRRWTADEAIQSEEVRLFLPLGVDTRAELIDYLVHVTVTTRRLVLVALHPATWRVA